MTLQQKIDTVLGKIKEKYCAKSVLYNAMTESYDFYITSMKKGDFSYSVISYKRKELIDAIERQG